MLRVSLLFLLSIFLQSCMNVATTGAGMVYNRHSLQKNFKDQSISIQAYRDLQNDKRFDDCNISISTFNQRVLLAGQVQRTWQRNEVEDIVNDIPDVERIYNLLVVSNPSSTLTRISDAWITAKIKSKLMAMNDLDATQIKVVTENGTVYLMGILTHSDAEEASDIASTTDGVESVVKIFSYMHISER